MEVHIIAITAVCFLSGTGVLAAGVIGLKRDSYIKTMGVQTQGEIIEIKRSGSNYKPVVEYRTSEGIIRAKSFYSGSGIFFNMRVGDKVNIFYDENKPKSFRFENNKLGTILWGVFILSGIMNMIFAFIIPLVLA